MEIDEDEVRQKLAEVLPPMTVDGGGAEILSLDSECLVLQLTGTCVFCPSKGSSAKTLEESLRKKLPAISRIEVVVENSDRKGYKRLV